MKHCPSCGAPEDWREKIGSSITDERTRFSWNSISHEELVDCISCGLPALFRDELGNPTCIDCWKDSE
jgi:predicted RNA-binding Zn-ribbon protein involved in translation (DUF1610 family)